jgi:hypothetical protein
MPNLPQPLYMILILPSLFGVILFSEGFNKIIHKEESGYISFFTGLLFLFGVFVAWYIFSTYLT